MWLNPSTNGAVGKVKGASGTMGKFKAPNEGVDKAKH